MALVTRITVLARGGYEHCIINKISVVAYLSNIRRLEPLWLRTKR